MEVPTVLSPLRIAEFRTVVVCSVFKVHTLDSVQQRLLSRTFLQLHIVEVFVVVFTVFLQFRAPQWIFQFLFFSHFSRVEKVRTLVLPPGRNRSRTRAHPRRALMAL